MPPPPFEYLWLKRWEFTRVYLQVTWTHMSVWKQTGSYLETKNDWPPEALSAEAAPDIWIWIFLSPLRCMKSHSEKTEHYFSVFKQIGSSCRIPWQILILDLKGKNQYYVAKYQTIYIFVEFQVLIKMIIFKLKQIPVITWECAEAVRMTEGRSRPCDTRTDTQ